MSQQLRDQIISMLGTKRSEATPTKDICKETNLTPRQLKMAISDLREIHPICSKTDEGGGYWIAEDNIDINRFTDHLYRRRNEIMKTIFKMQDHKTNK